ncbi:MAG TPA: hypothetical protein VHK01_17950 [Lacipirellulaceae bacterium]|jgi:hypothetical protein|nr:hypothetical protein [Lacipirellulaceae bacterium]
MRLRRITRFRLRTLLILMAVVAVLIGGIRHAVDQHHVEQDALRKLREYRFPVTVKVEQPWWVPARINSQFNRVFDRVVHLSISGQSLDWERGLSLDPRNFNDEHVPLLSRFHKLGRLDLSSTDVSSKSVDGLVALRSVKVLDISRTRVGNADISEFKTRRPDCLVCESQPWITAQLHSDHTITIGDERGRLKEAHPLLTAARRGPDAFGYVPMLYIFADDQLVRRRAEMIGKVRAAAMDAGYQKIQIGW